MEWDYNVQLAFVKPSASKVNRHYKSNSHLRYRDMFVDKLIKKAFNSDLNGAVNHINIACPKKRSG